MPETIVAYQSFVGVDLHKAAVTMCHSDTRQEAIRQRIIQGNGGSKAKANVAMGRRLLGTLYAMVRDNQPYKSGPRLNRTSAANKAKSTNTQPLEMSKCKWIR